jgi:ribosomal protein L37E
MASERMASEWMAREGEHIDAELAVLVCRRCHLYGPSRSTCVSCGYRTQGPMGENVNADSDTALV